LEATALHRPKDLKCMYPVAQTNFVIFKGRHTKCGMSLLEG
jgi:hypothetical protein